MMKELSFLPRVIFFVAIVLFFSTVPCRAGRWTTQVVAETEIRYWKDLSTQSMALDGNDCLHAVYSIHTSETSYRLQYLFNDGSGWTTEIADPNTSQNVEYASVATDSLDRPHVAYSISRGNDYYELRYAVKIGGVWQISVLDTDSRPISTPSIVLDSSDHVHITYCRMSINYTDHTVEYITNETGSWNRRAVHLIDTYSKAKPQIGLNASEQPVIFYLWEGNLMEAAWNGSSWDHELIYNPEPISTAEVKQLSATADSTGAFHLSCIVDFSSYNNDMQLSHWTNAGGTWAYEVIEQTDGLWIRANSITLDTADQVHLFYSMETEENNAQLYHAYGTFGSTTHESVGDNTIIFCCAAAAADGSLHTLLEKANGGQILYAQNSTGTWQYESLDRSILIGQKSSLALNSSGDAVIAYTSKYSANTDLSGLFIAENSTGNWETECVTFVGQVDSDRALAIDSNDTLHIVYPNCSYSMKSLLYSENSSGEFVEQLLDPQSGKTASLALDQNDDLHILHLYEFYQSYVCYPNGTVPEICTQRNYHLDYSTNAGGTWQTEILLQEAAWGTSGSIAVDSLGNAHAVYVADTATETQIKYLSNTTGTWSVKQTVSLSSNEGYARIAVDSSDKIHIMYLDVQYTGTTLHHYTNATGYWNDEIVDVMSGRHAQLSLAIDPADHVHTCYDGVRCLKYATNLPGSWDSETIAENLDYTHLTHPSIAVDAAGIHISYSNHYDYYTVSLMYVTDTLPSKAIEVEPLSLSFISNEGGSSTLPVTIRNIGNLELKVGAASITGDDAAQFSKADSLPINLAVDGSTQIDVTFDPTAIGSYNAQLVIPSDDPDLPVVTVDLQGLCFAVPGPYLEWIPPKNWEGFGEVIVGQTSATAPFTIQNNSSTYTITTSDIMVSDTDNFHVVPSPYPGACPGVKIFSLPPGEHCSVGVTFTPTEVGDFESVLYVYANSPFFAEASALLEGTGVPVPQPELVIWPTEHDFGPQQITTASTELSIDIANTGDAVMKISGVIHTNDPNFILDLDGGKFPIGSGFPVNLEPGEVRTCTVSFAPQQIGEWEDMVIIEAYTEGQVLLSGEGTHWNLCDFDIDGTVDLDDLAILTEQWTSKVMGWPPDVTPDLPDGRINLYDLAVFAANWLESLEP